MERDYPYERYHSKARPVLSRWLRGNVHWAIKSLGKPRNCRLIMVSFSVPPWIRRWTLPRRRKMFPCPLGFVFYLLHISLYKLLLAIVLVLVVNHEIFQGKPGAWQHQAQTHWSSSAGLVSTVSYTTAACFSVRVMWFIRNSSQDKKEERKKHYSELSHWLKHNVKLFLLKVGRYWDSSNIWLCRCKPDCWC